MNVNITTSKVTAVTCRFCGEGLHTSFVDLGMSPFCNTHVEQNQLNQMEAFFPLHVWVCTNCFLVQLEEYVTPDNIFTEYAYFSSYSDSWVEHARLYTNMMRERFVITSKSLVMEIASNDGYLLQHFVQSGIPVLGIEPAANVTKAAEARGVRSEVCFHSRESAARLVAQYGQADLVLGNNVLAHVPNLNDFVAGMQLLLKPEGVITMEFPHLLQLMAHNQFDTIYHEHFSYLSFYTVEKVFAAHGLILFDVEQLPTHGGSIRIFARHAADQSKPVSARAHALRDRELTAGISRIETYQSFADQVKSTKRKILAFLIELKNQGKCIVGYGAPGKGNTLLNYCGIRTDIIDYLVDRNPYKQGKYTPGTHIPIFAPEKIRETRPDFIVIMPWNLQDEITEQMRHTREWGCKFVTVIPQPSILD